MDQLKEINLKVHTLHESAWKTQPKGSHLLWISSGKSTREFTPFVDQFGETDSKVHTFCGSTREVNLRVHTLRESAWGTWSKGSQPSWISSAKSTRGFTTLCGSTWGTQPKGSHPLRYYLGESTQGVMCNLVFFLRFIRTCPKSIIFGFCPIHDLHKCRKKGNCRHLILFRLIINKT